MIKQDRLVVATDLKALTQIQQWFSDFCKSSGDRAAWVIAQFDGLNLALAEGFTNAVRHAHAELPPTTPIVIEVSLWPNRIEIRIWDQGQPFDPTVLKDPEPGALLEGGYGWFLIRRIADQVQYLRSQQGGNCLWIIKSGAS